MDNVSLTKKRIEKIYNWQISLEFTDDALEEVAQLALERKVGARALRYFVGQFEKKIY